VIVSKQRFFVMAVVVLVVALSLGATLSGCGPKKVETAQGSEEATIAPPPPSGDPATDYAKKGEKLAVVAVPPAEMISRMKYQKTFEGAVYDSSFDVYGTGPATLGHATLMARVGVSAPRKTGTGRLPVDKHNALLLLDKGVKVTKGGHYTAELTLLADGDSMYFLVKKVAAD
jgi:hypothetical protein